MIDQVPESKERKSYSSPAHPAIYKLGMNNSSQNFLFRYSVIKASPAIYEPGLISGSIDYTNINTDSSSFDLPVEVNFTMKNPDKYLEYAGRISELSDIHGRLKKNQAAKTSI